MTIAQRETAPEGAVPTTGMGTGYFKGSSVLPMW